MQFRTDRPSRPLAVLIGLLAVASLAHAGPAKWTNPTPARLFGPLFVRVQMDAIFPDGMTFVDAVPKAAPSVILQRYRKNYPRTRTALRRFVEQNFTLPPPDRTRVPPAPTLRAHIALLWPLLTRRSEGAQGSQQIQMVNRSGVSITGVKAAPIMTIPCIRSGRLERHRALFLIGGARRLSAPHDIDTIMISMS